MKSRGTIQGMVTSAMAAVLLTGCSQQQGDLLLKKKKGS